MLNTDMITTTPAWRYATVVFRLCLAVVFLVAGGSKIPNAWAFVHTVEGYNMLPQAIARPFGLALPWIEVLIGLYLLAGLFLRVTALVTAGVLVLFLIALSVQIARGTTGNCGCVVGITNPIVTWFIGGNSIGAFDLVRDGVLLLMALAVAVTPHPPLAVDAWLAARREELAEEDYDTVVA
jgi:uncharacterized membrane protein YphA (DoxX/SURF4 family)